MKKLSVFFRGVFLTVLLLFGAVLFPKAVSAQSLDGKTLLTIETTVVADSKNNFRPIEIQLTDERQAAIHLTDVPPEINSTNYYDGSACGTYQAKVSEGTYQYTAFDPFTKVKLGSGSFHVKNGVVKQEVFLSLYDFEGMGSSKNLNNYDKVAYSLKITGPDGKTDFPVGDSGLTAVLPVRDGEEDDAYTYAFIPEDRSYWGSSGKLWVYARNRTDGFAGLNASDAQQEGFLIAPKTTIQLQVESGAEVQICHMVRFYRPLEYMEGKKVLSEDGIDTWEFVVPNKSTGNGHLHYEVRKEGKITQAKQFSVSEYADKKQILKVPELKDDPKTQLRDDSQSFYEASILVNGPTGKMVTLQQGESFDIWASRAWQAVTDTSINYYVDPDFHYTLVSGDSIHLRKDGRVTGVKPGVSVVQITYDALDFQGKVYSAIWPERTGVLIFNVGDTKEANISMNIGLTEYDTIYYARTVNGEQGDRYATYSFAPAADRKITGVRVQKPLQTNWEDGWETYQPDGDGTYQIKLYDGPNIVEVRAGNSVKYHVIHANGLEISIRNKGITDRDDLTVGDTAVVSFEGLVLPLPKLGAVYNPGYPSETYLQYEVDGVTTEGGHCQWNIRDANSIEIKLEEEGVIQLKNGTIHTTSIGSVPTTHQKLTKESTISSYSGGNSDESVNGCFCKLPDVEIKVEDAKEASEFEKLNYIGIMAKTLPTSMTAARSGNPVFGRAANQSIFTTMANQGVGNAANTPTLVKSDELLPQNVVFWAPATNQLLNKTASPVYVRVRPTVQDVSMTLRYWSTMEGHTTPQTLPLDYNVLTQTEAFAGSSDAAYFEIILTPNQGVEAYPKTYAMMANAKAGDHYGKLAYLYGLEFHALDGQEEMSVLDGLLHAEDQDGIDFGYGFIGTETEYTVTVPYTTSEITLTPTALEEKNTVEITVDGKSVTNQKASQVIALQDGITKIPVTVTVSDSEGILDTKTYTVKVKRSEAPKKVSFHVDEDAALLVKNESGKKMTAEEEGCYLLDPGEYTAAAYKSGYLAETVSFRVGNEAEQVVSIPALKKVPKQSGSVNVSIAGYDAVICQSASVSIGDAKDLAAQKYVEYNYGGYTILQAMIEALENSKNRISFSCSKGSLLPGKEADTAGHGEDAGWVCEINGVVCEDPANTLAKDDDVICYYYNADYEGMLHTWMNPETAAINKGEEVLLRLSGTPVQNDGRAALPVAEADIYEGSRWIGQTDSDGEFLVPADKISALGNHRLTAVKRDKNGNNILTANLCTITVKKVLDSSADPNTTAVTFRLIGDVKHGDAAEKHAYTTWLATETYTFDKEEVTVAEVFAAALEEAGLTYEGLEENYIRSITAPSACGDYRLAEKENGLYSGWMYTVNGFHPGDGVQDCYVTTGDEIVFHYIEDYRYEAADWSGGSRGDASTWEKWLEAEDVTPGAKEHASKAEQQIAAIGEVTLESQEAIEAARAVYDALTREEKRYVTNYLTLTEAEAQLGKLQKQKGDQEAAETVAGQIKELPSAENLTLEDREMVEEVRNAYMLLTDDQKKLIPEELYESLNRAETRMAELLEAAAVELLEQEIQALPPAEELTLREVEAVERVKAHYDALSEDKKKEVAPELLDELTAALDRMQELKKEAADQEAAQGVMDQIAALPPLETLVLTDEPSVDAARHAYEALTEDQKAYVTKDFSDALTALEDRIEELRRQEEPTPGPTPTPTSPPTPTSTPTPTPTSTPTPAPENPNQPAPTPVPGKEDGDITLTYQNYPISVTGKNLSGYELRLEALKASDSDVKLMQKEITSKEALIRLYDVRLFQDNQEVLPEGTLTLRIQVGEKYNGKTLRILHVVNGRIETLTGKVTDGVVSVETRLLGKFGVAVEASTVTVNSPGSGTSSENRDSSGSGSGTSRTGKVKTGDRTEVLPLVIALIAAAGVCTGLVVYKKKKNAHK